MLTCPVLPKWNFQWQCQGNVHELNEVIHGVLTCEMHGKSMTYRRGNFFLDFFSVSVL